MKLYSMLLVIFILFMSSNFFASEVSLGSWRENSYKRSYKYKYRLCDF